MTKQTLLGKQTVIKTNLGFLIIGAMLIGGWGVSYADLKNKVETNAVSFGSVSKQTEVFEVESVETKIRLAEIQTTLKNIEVTLEELKRR